MILFAFAVIQNEAKQNEESSNFKHNNRFFELRSHPLKLCQNDTMCVNFTLYIN